MGDVNGNLPKIFICVETGLLRMREYSAIIDQTRPAPKAVGLISK